MSDVEAASWLKLLQAGGNAGIIVLCIVAIKVAQAFLARLGQLADEMRLTREQLAKGQEQIKLAIVAGNPKLAENFRQSPG